MPSVVVDLSHKQNLSPSRDQSNCICKAGQHQIDREWQYRTYQGQQLVEPSADAKVPAGHAVHSVSPGMFVNVPAGHGVPAGRPVWLQYAPGVQGEHTPAPPELYVPMGHASHTVEPG